MRSLPISSRARRNSYPPTMRPITGDVIEGQGSLFHPAYAGVTLGLLHGSQPDAIVLCHDPSRRTIDEYPDFPIPDLQAAIDDYLARRPADQPSDTLRRPQHQFLDSLRCDCAEYFRGLTAELDCRYAIPCVPAWMCWQPLCSHPCGDGSAWPRGMGSLKATKTQLPSGFPSPLPLTLGRSTSWAPVASALCVDLLQYSPGGVRSLLATVFFVAGRLLTLPGERCLQAVERSWRSQRRWVGRRIVAVRQDDDREAPLRVAHDDVAKSDRFARMPASLAGDAPAEAILNGRIVGRGRSLEREAQRGRPQKPVLAKCRIPFREVVDGGIDTAVAEGGAGQALIGARPRMPGGAVAEGAVRDDRLACLDATVLCMPSGWKMRSRRTEAKSLADARPAMSASRE